MSRIMVREQITCQRMTTGLMEEFFVVMVVEVEKEVKIESKNNFWRMKACGDGLVKVADEGDGDRDNAASTGVSRGLREEPEVPVEHHVLQPCGHLGHIWRVLGDVFLPKIMRPHFFNRPTTVN